MNTRQETYAAIKKMIATLDDPFTRFLEPEKFKSLRSGTQNALTGVGLSIAYPTGKTESAPGLVVVSASPGGPADRAGISSGDIILEIDNSSTENMGIYDAAERLQGPEGSGVELTVRRGSETRNLPLIREKVSLNPVKSRICKLPTGGDDAPQIGYIKLSTFNQNASGAVKEAIEALRKSNVNAFVLDLRDNSGGLFPEGVEIAKIWLNKGVIVYICDSGGVRDIYDTDGSNVVAASERLAVLVEEIDDIEDSSVDPFVADAIANERELNLSEEQKRKYKKVKEEDDLKIDLKLRRHLKQRRHRNMHKLEEIHEDTTDDMNGSLSQDVDFHTNRYSTIDDGDVPLSKCLPETDSDAKGLKRVHNSEEMEAQSKKPRIITLDGDEEDLPGEKLSPACSLSETGDQSNPQRNGDDVLPISSLPAFNEKQNFRCTACDKVAVELRAHPLLKVIVCLDCKNSMKAKMQDVDCSECYCRWCGRCSDLLSCKSCKRLFCSVCVRRNLGEETLLGIKTFGWQCCCCSPSILHPLVSELEKIMESQGLVDSSTDTDSDNSDADVNGHRSTKRRRKKKIRRILDDTELGEETKRKIAIEKERQERLKSLGAKYSSETMFMNSGACCKTSYESGSLEMLGDVGTGYIVNVVREDGKEAVRIPPSISAKLKAHQVAGIRFMWENIIQSIRKVKSGDKGLGCILAHTMGLGKTFQVISFLYAAMRSVDLGLRTALIVTPVSVLHNWRQEFIKWRPSELKPLRVFMLEDVPRFLFF